MSAHRPEVQWGDEGGQFVMTRQFMITVNQFNEFINHVNDLSQHLVQLLIWLLWNTHSIWSSVVVNQRKMCFEVVGLD